MDGPGFLEPIPEDVSVVAASQHSVNLSTVSAMASSDSRGMVAPHAKIATSTEGGTAIEDNVSDVNASLCGSNEQEFSATKVASTLSEETLTPIFLSPKCKNWTCIFFGIVSSLAIAIGIGVYFVVVRVPDPTTQTEDVQTSTAQPPKLVFTYSTASPTFSPVYSPEEIKMLDEAMMNAFGTSEVNIFDMNTPQGKGRDWMINSDSGIVMDAQRTPQSVSQRVQQRYILSVLYFATNGDFWKEKWMNPVRPECNWHGVTCNKLENTIEGIDISDNNVTGTLPNEIASLSTLSTFNVTTNSITGTIPSKFFDLLNNIQTLDMHNNQFSGRIPERSILIEESRLRMLNVESNQFTGMLPFFKNVEFVKFGKNNLTSIDSRYSTDAQSLKVFKGYHNRITGTLPTLWNTNNLIELDLGFNFLTGTISQDLWNLASLKTLFLDHCNLTGPLPNHSESHSMHRLWLDSNLLSGTIPFGFGWNWTKLYSVNLQRNLLTGSITQEQCKQWVTQRDKPRGRPWKFNTDCQIDCACCTNTNCSASVFANADGQ